MENLQKLYMNCHWKGPTYTFLYGLQIRGKYKSTSPSHVLLAALLYLLPNSAVGDTGGDPFPANSLLLCTCNP